MLVGVEEDGRAIYKSKEMEYKLIYKGGLFFIKPLSGKIPKPLGGGYTNAMEANRDIVRYESSIRSPLVQHPPAKVVIVGDVEVSLETGEEVEKKPPVKKVSKKKVTKPTRRKKATAKGK